MWGLWLLSGVTDELEFPKESESIPSITRDKPQRREGRERRARARTRRERTIQCEQLDGLVGAGKDELCRILMNWELASEWMPQSQAQRLS